MRLLLVLLAMLVAPASAAAQAMGGAPTDALDYPGSPTDRYLVAGEIRDALHAANDSFFQCFRQHARAGVDASDVGVTFVIGRDGRGSDVRPELGDAPPEPMPVMAPPPGLARELARLRFGLALLPQPLDRDQRRRDSDSPRQTTRSPTKSV